MERLQVLCFAGTYSLALACDLARSIVRGAARWYATIGLTALGLVVHSAYLAQLAGRRRELLFTSEFESLLLLAWILAAIDLYLLLRSPRSSAVGLFVQPLVLAVLAYAGWRASRVGWTGSDGGWLAFWGLVHGLLLLGGAVGASVAFIAGLMYLAQAHRLKQKRPSRLGFALPSLEQSERWNRRAITLAFPLLSFGILTGLALIAATRRDGGAVLRWTDPKVISSLVLWTFFAGLLHARYRPEWRGRRVMLLTVVAFASLAFATVGVNLVLPTAHGARSAAGRAP